MTQYAGLRKIGATVIDGVCRDVAKALGDGYPLFSRGRFMRTGKDRVEVAEVGGPVTVAGVQVRAGDLVVGDADGVVVVAAEIEGEVLAICESIAERESRILADVLAGMSLAEARGAHGYHLLQRRVDEPDGGSS
jgi:regulator of RNase E activity RraA